MTNLIKSERTELIDLRDFGYSIVRELGRNLYQNRITYLATSNDGTKVVAIKRFGFALPEAREITFQAVEQEIETLKVIDHPNIPRYLDDFCDELNIFLVQEYVEAENINTKEYSSLTFNSIIAQLLNVLVYLQDLPTPIFHNDIKPENILVNNRDEVYLIDFGLSNFQVDRGNQSSIIAGTNGYIAPEKLRGKSYQNSDLYSLSVTLAAVKLGIPSSEISDLIDDSFSLKFPERENPDTLELWLENMGKGNYKERFNSPKTAQKWFLAMINSAPGGKSTATMTVFEPKTAALSGRESYHLVEGKIKDKKLVTTSGEVLPINTDALNLSERSDVTVVGKCDKNGTLQVVWQEYQPGCQIGNSDSYFEACDLKTIVEIRTKWLNLCGRQKNIREKKIEETINSLYSSLDLSNPEIIFLDKNLSLSGYRELLYSKNTGRPIESQVKIERVLEIYESKIEENIEPKDIKRIKQAFNHNMTVPLFALAEESQKVEDRIDSIENFRYKDESTFVSLTNLRINLALLEYLASRDKLGSYNNLHELIQLGENVGHYAPFENICFVARRPEISFIHDRLSGNAFFNLFNSQTRIIYRGNSIASIPNSIKKQRGIKWVEKQLVELFKECYINSLDSEYRHDLLDIINPEVLIEALKLFKGSVVSQWNGFKLYKLRQDDFKVNYLVTPKENILRVPLNVHSAEFASNWCKGNKITLLQKIKNSLRG